ncbi:MAG: glycosyltransferase [Patescibacteria group bacterium]|nr:glycosyltransferase [Patescibacteria group bacterium]
MKLIYLANIRLPTEKAHGYQIMQTCAEFARQGVDVTLVVPERKNITLQGADAFAYYGIKQKFPIVRLPVVDWVGKWRTVVGPLGFWIETWTFANAAKNYLRKNISDWVYSRDELVLKLIGKLRRPVAVELHALPTAKYQPVLSRSKIIVVISRAISEALALQGVDRGKIVVAPDAVQVESFGALPSREECRKIVSLDAKRKIVVYAGHLYPWKGAYTLVEASAHLPPEWVTVLVGGTADDQAKLHAFARRQNVSQVKMVGHHPRQRVPYYLGAADVLVIPNSGKTDRSRLYTSPLKLFEYLVAGRPIVASDLPSIREIVSEREVIFVKPDDPKDLARGIREAGELDQTARVGAAKILARQHTWENRAKVIIGSLEAVA